MEGTREDGGVNKGIMRLVMNYVEHSNMCVYVCDVNKCIKLTSVLNEHIQSDDHTKVDISIYTINLQDVVALGGAYGRGEASPAVLQGHAKTYLLQWAVGLQQQQWRKLFVLKVKIAS